MLEKDAIVTTNYGQCPSFAVCPDAPGQYHQARVEVFPGTEHGFAFPERAIYNTLAAEETWDKMFAMWDRTLK